MVKVPITIKISPEVAAHIEQHRKINPEFSLSPWIEEKYKSQFMEYSVLHEKLLEVETRERNIQEEKQQILDRIKFNEEQKKAEEKKLTKDALNFLKDVPRRMEEGFKGKAMYRSFTSDFKVNVDYKGFLTLVAKESGMPLEDIMLIHG